ncbi:MAG: hypothetical protein DHS20C05_00220 [Hyphococcus sp.]|nr:MAG: hypothetical protein DHS20C05_00220 [Marinicaulis sp.]
MIEAKASENFTPAPDDGAAQDRQHGRSVSAASFSARDDFDRDVWCLMGLPVDAADINRAVAEIDASVRDQKKLSFVTPNVNWMVSALRDPEVRQEILDADMSFVDGAPLVMMAKMLGVPVRSRVAGSDIFEALRRRPAFAGRPLRVFFFGGRDGAAEKAVAALEQEHGGVTAAGYHNPGFGDVASMSTPEIISKINGAKPDFVLVALGARKGQAWIDQNKERLDAPVTAHLGAVIDFAAGAIQRAPTWVQKAGFEWAWRIKEEPSLWKRYLKDGVSLAGALVSRLAPQLIARTGRASGREAVVNSINNASETFIELSGDLTRVSLSTVRPVLRMAAERKLDVVLDLSNVEYFDRAFLGLVLMLEKHVARSGRTLYVNGANAGQKAVFRANAMGYPSYEGITEDEQDLNTAAI